MSQDTIKLIMIQTIFLAIIILALVINTFVITEEIKMHSIHPVYGNYSPKINEDTGLQCEPWDSCRKKP